MSDNFSDIKRIIKEFDGDKIEEFLTTIDMKEIIAESSSGKGTPTDDGPPTFYKTFTDYKSRSKNWIQNLQTQLGWEVVNYVLSDGAEDPEIDFTMSYRSVPAISFGKKDPYKNRLRDVLDNLGWRVIKWLGVDGDQLLAGPPVAPGVDKIKDNTLNTTLKAKKSSKFSGGSPRLHAEGFSTNWWKENLFLD